MSSYNEIAKIKYESESSDPVTLAEYVLFGDERAQKKVIVFKFENNVNQQLLGMSFEVSQYDREDALIGKSVVVYNKFLAKANETFVPKAKLPVDYDCVKISVRLLKAAFDRFLWDDGNYVDNCYKFSHYVHDEELIEGRKAEAVAAAQQSAPPRKPPRPRVYAFSARNVTRKNIAKFPAVFNWLICIFVIAFVAVSLYIYRTRSNHTTLKDFDLKVVGDTVAICGYYGDYDDGELTIPEKIGDYYVASVAEGAFRYNRQLKKVHFDAPNLIIETGAFVNCPRLTEVSAPDGCIVIVNGKAFRGCKQIETIDMDGATLAKESFFGSYGVTSMTIGAFNSNVTNYRHFFGANADVALSLPRFSCNKATPSDFFEGIE